MVWARKAGTPRPNVRAAAYRRFDVRRSGGERTPARRHSTQEPTLARRALALLDRLDGRRAGVDYAVTDVQTVRGTGRRKGHVVYVQQRHLGLPVYDGRRSVIFVGRRYFVTGRPLAVRALPRLVPVATAEESVRAAFGHVFDAACPAIEELSSFGSAERFAAFRVAGLRRASAHVAVLPVRGRAHLAWVVDLAQDEGSRFEVILEGRTLRLLRRRLVTQSADACISLPPGQPPGAKVPFDPAWRQAKRVKVTFDGQGWTPPGAGSSLCGTTVRDLHSLNAFSLGNIVLDVCTRFLPRLETLKVDVEISQQRSLTEAGAARADEGLVQLLGVAATPDRFAALDPTVVLHEVSHVVLCTAVGGSAFVNPFERDAESGAVSEGLADFLGLTLWQSLCRAMAPARTADTAFGALFMASGREYASYLAGSGATLGPANGPHRRGMFLCGALLRARRELVLRGLSDDQADTEMWSALCRALPMLPHQGSQPDFCCVRKAFVEALPAPLQAVADGAFAAIQLPASCSHVTGGVQ